MKKVVLNLPLFLALAFAGCQKDVSSTNDPQLISALSSTDKTNTFYGPQVHLGNGMARSWITIDKAGMPQAIGAELTPGALQGLPDAQPGYTYNLPFHQKAQAVTPYDHISLDWNPFGHPPPGIFDVPHFDIHFYMISLAQQMAIPVPNNANMVNFMHVNPGALPTDYVVPGGPVPQMGMHWLDRTDPVLRGTPFAYTFIYGTYNGPVIFQEPMITRAYLLSNQSVSEPIKQPTVYSPMGTNYPTQFNITTDQKTGNRLISLSEFVAH